MVYEWAENLNKLQRAIARAKAEQVGESQKNKRIKELYISYGGRLSLEDVKEHIITNEEIGVASTNDTTDNKENNIPAAEVKPKRGRPPRTNNSTVK